MDRPHFSIFGIPVRVRSSFALTILFGMDRGLRGVIEWIVVVFVSVLAHELGHALLGRAFGLRPTVELYAFGGQTSWIGGKNVGAGKSVLISLIGPGVSLMLAALGVVLMIAVPNGEKIFGVFTLINGFWGLFNLLPIMPMDGGNALRSFLIFVKRKRLAEIGTRVLGVVVAAPVAVFFGLKGLFFGVIFLVMFAASNIQSLVQYLKTERDSELFDALRANYPKWMEQKDGKNMIAAALAARREATTDFLRAYSTEVLAMGQCIDGDAKSALATLESSMPPGMMPGLPIYLHVLFEAGETERATDLAKQAMVHGDDELRQQAAAALASHPA